MNRLSYAAPGYELKPEDLVFAEEARQIWRDPQNALTELVDVGTKKIGRVSVAVRRRGSRLSLNALVC